MDIEKIRTLIELMEEKDLVSLEVACGDERVSLTRQSTHAALAGLSLSGLAHAGLDTTARSVVAGHVEQSPMVGVFYVAPSPNDPPFVTVGQKVKAGDTLGIIEAMKIMNPLEATQNGIIDAILVENGDVVQFGQPIVRYKI